MQKKMGWKSTAAAVAAVLLAIMFLVSGGWKMLQPFQTGELLEQAKVPAGLGTLGAASLGTLEVLTAVLLLSPRYRRLGGWLGSALLVFFIGWIGYYYKNLVGQECSCFPIIKRSIGPGFFIGDGVMLALGLMAAVWARTVDLRRLTNLRLPGMALASLMILAGASFAVSAGQRSKVELPAAIDVNGKPENLNHGKVLLYFYDPQCSHCQAAAKFLAKEPWDNTRIVGIPTVNPQFAADFLEDTKLKADTSKDVAKLRQRFQFTDPPYAAALVNGSVQETFTSAKLSEPYPEADFRKLGFVR